MSDNQVDRLEVEPSVEEVELAPGLYVPQSFEVRAKNWQGYDLHLRFNLATDRYRCGELHVYQRDNGDEVTGDVLRRVPVTGLMQHAAREVVDTSEMPEAVPERNGRTPSEDTLRAVSAVYRFAFALGMAPKIAVATQLGISTATASRWILRAREEKYLSSVDEFAERSVGTQRSVGPVIVRQPSRRQTDQN